MTATEPQVALTGRYSAGETAKILGISDKTLYNYTQDLRIKFSIRRSNGRKFFKGSDIIQCWKAEY